MRDDSIIITYKKHRFSPRNPSANDIEIADIAHALSCLCRANGHLDRYYSVAAHSINCMREGKAAGFTLNQQKALLLHDASEAYLSDIIRPVKLLLPDYLVMERRLQNIIYEKYGVKLDDETRQRVSEVDDALLYHEFLTMAGERLFNEDFPLFSQPDFSASEAAAAEQAFLAEFAALAEI